MNYQIQIESLELEPYLEQCKENSVVKFRYNNYPQSIHYHEGMKYGNGIIKEIKGVKWFARNDEIKLFLEIEVENEKDRKEARKKYYRPGKKAK